MKELIIWLILSLAFWISFLAIISQIMQIWLWDLVMDWIDIFTYLFGTAYVYIFLGLFSIWWFTLILRWVLSWYGENPWHSANK